jgi:hypothetical protein
MNYKTQKVGSTEAHIIEFNPLKNPSQIVRAYFEVRQPLKDFQYILTKYFKYVIINYK